MDDTIRSLLNEQYFNRAYFFEDYGRLYELGADLNYVDFVCCLFCDGERHRANRLKPKSKDKVDEKQKIRAALLKPPGDDSIRCYASIVIAVTAKLIAERHLPGKEPWDLLSEDEDAKWIIDHSLSEFERLWQEYTVQEDDLARREFQKTLESFEMSCEKLPVFRLVRAYDNPGRPKPGNAVDLWGTFFLLAITEHLRAAKTRKPHHEDAVKLLRKLRNGSEEVSVKNSGVKSAENRISRFKKQYPSWRNDLALIKEQIRIFSPHKN